MNTFRFHIPLLGLLTACLGIIILGLAPVRGQIFVGVGDGANIFSFSLSGTSLGNFNDVPYDTDPVALAIAGNDIYVADEYDHVVGEYTTSGAVVNQTLISNLGIDEPTSLAVIGSDLLVSTYGKIAEYSLSGNLLNPSFISNISASCMAVSGDDLFVDYVSGGNDLNTVAEYDATTGALINPSLIANVHSTADIAVSGGYIYLSDYEDGLVSKWTTSGTLVKGTLIDEGHDGEAAALAVDGNNLYLSGPSSDAISEFDATTGTPINLRFISTPYYNPASIAIEDVPEPSTITLEILGLVVIFRAIARRAPKQSAI